MKAPDFALPDQTGVVHELKSYRGKWVVLFFYPKDDTPGCTKEACSFRDHAEATTEDVIIFGVSKDSVDSHQKFADKYGLSFPLLSDTSTDMIKAYDAWGPKKFMGKEFLGTQRKTVIVDPEGNIAKRYEKVDPDGHAELVLNDIAQIKETIKL